MTVAEARKVLSGKLRFGDAKQINAHQFLEKIEILVERIDGCQFGHDLEDDVEDIAWCKYCDPDCEDEYALEAAEEWRRRKLAARRKSN